LLLKKAKERGPKAGKYLGKSIKGVPLNFQRHTSPHQKQKNFGNKTGKQLAHGLDVPDPENDETKVPNEKRGTALRREWEETLALWGKKIKRRGRGAELVVTHPPP